MTNLERLYEQASRDGIAVENFPLPQNASIALEIDGKYYIGIDPKRFDTRTEEAECLAHEIGHCQTKSLYHTSNVLPVKRQRLFLSFIQMKTF